MWQRCKTAIFNSYTRNNRCISKKELKSIDAAISMKRHKTDRRPQPKADSARSFITYLMQFYASLSPNEGKEHIRILPFKRYRNCMKSIKHTIKQLPNRTRSTAWRLRRHLGGNGLSYRRLAKKNYHVERGRFLLVTFLTMQMICLRFLSRRSVPNGSAK
jgi:hypothetical protein